MKKKKIIVLLIVLFLFITNTVLVKLGITKSFDDAIHNFLYNLYSSRNEKAMNTITFFGSTLWIVSLAVFVFVICFKNNRSKSFIVACSIALSTILNNVIKVIVRRPRPLNMLIVENTLSYPSGHMMASTTMYGLLVYFLIKSNVPKKYKVFYAITLILFALSIGFSRIYLRAHFFTDVFGAMLCSISIIITVDILNDKYKWLKD